MRRLGLLLTFVIVLVMVTAAPAGAASGDAQEQSGSGMNRQGGPSEHPGRGWKDPGQDQGSPTNLADPDCTGNRTRSPQATNIGSCDDDDGAADSPGGSGGFDADKDWNNGCGNDTDFEDDNNGQCRGPQRATTTVTPPTKPTKPTTTTSTKPPAPPRSSSDATPPGRSATTPADSDAPSTARPRPSSLAPAPPVRAPSGEVDTGAPADAPPAPVEIPLGLPVEPETIGETITRPLPATGAVRTTDLTAISLALVTVGTVMSRYERRRR